MKITVLGAGSWGTALSMTLWKNGHSVYLWTHDEKEAKYLEEKRKCMNLPDVVIPKEIAILTSLEEAVKEGEVLVYAVPSIFTRSMGERTLPLVRKEQILVTVSKGIEESTLYTMTDILEEFFPENKIAVLSGPSHAEEVSRFIPTTIVCASKDEETARKIQSVFISDTLGYGDNTMAALITRGIAEIARLGQAMGCHLETFAGLSGIGDLIVTCASKHSRNRRAGILIGKGETYEEAMKEVGQVVEGVYAAKAAKKLGEKYHVDLPIVKEVNAVLFEGKAAKDAVSDLMLRDRRSESAAVSFDK